MYLPSSSASSPLLLLLRLSPPPLLHTSRRKSRRKSRRMRRRIGIGGIGGGCRRTGGWHFQGGPAGDASCRRGISFTILATMKEPAKAYLDTKVNDAVVPAPAYLNDSQRRATHDTGQICGLNGLRILTRMVRASAMFSFIIWVGGLATCPS